MELGRRDLDGTPPACARPDGQLQRPGARSAWCELMGAGGGRKVVKAPKSSTPPKG